MTICPETPLCSDVPLGDDDRALVLATQGGLPVSATPYHDVAASLGWPVDRVLSRLAALQDAGIIRRIGVIPNHYRLGWVANAMTVWDVDDTRIDDLGQQVGALPFVTHCYRRPRALPEWPYSLFAMVHGRERAETEAHITIIQALLGEACRGHTALYSTRILKKTGIRLSPT